MWNTSEVAEQGSTVFVGRVAELDRLEAALAALPERGAATVLLGGDAGMGKSRLVEEFCARARHRGALVAVGACIPAEGGGLPYGPVVGVLRDVARQLPPADVAGVLGFAQRSLGLAPALPTAATEADAGSPPESGLVKTKLFGSLLNSIETLTARAPVVLVFEDLQWADSASIEVIDFLTRNLHDHPVLLVATYRADEIDRGGALRRLLAELGRHSRVSQLELAGLDRPEIASLLSEIVGGSPDWTLVDAVLTRSGGNPFFAEELAAARHAKTLPNVLRNVVMMRIERLSANAQHVVGVAAAAGASIHYRLMAAAARVDADELDAAVAEACEQKVLVADGREGSFRFRHALLREAAYDALLPGERARLHRALALALTAHSELGAAGPGYAAMELADHWWDAADWPEALRASATAADAAAAVFAMPEAYAYFERALAAGDLLPTDAPAWRGIDRIDLDMKTADAAYMSGETQRSVDLVRQALSALDADTDPRRAAICYTMLGRNAWAIGDSQLALDALHEAARLLPAETPSVELAGVLAEEARSLMLLSYFDRAEATARAAIATARAAGARMEEGHALNTLGCILSDRGDATQALTLLHESLAIAEELSNPDQLYRGYNNLAHVLSQAGQLEAAAALVFEGDAASDKFVGIRLGAAGQNSAEALIHLGRLDEADDLLRRLARGTGNCVCGPFAVRAVIAIRRGLLDDAVALLATADELSGGLDTVNVQGWLHALRAEVHLERGEPRPAMEEVERALTTAVGSQEDVLVVEMHSLGLRGVADDLDEARAKQRRIDLDKVQRLASGMLGEVETVMATREARGHAPTPSLSAFVALCRAEASRTTGPDPDLWRAAAESWDAACQPYPAAYCRWREAEYLLGARLDRKRATESAQRAWRSSVEIGTPLLRARIERLAERARITLAPAAVDATATTRSVAADLGLTPREVEVLAQLAKGRTDRQIAEELFISKKTASVHVSNLLRKLDAANRIEAAEIGQRVSLV
ncbi:MAG TPA: AAA family ATPase [Acidothermaceae bacterium]|jgi:DNA-binding CsgD family transcriptional regulator/tetratricopeptide (TPR) repeat protein|nr:AAA family ATPase [Acidothermaceae bacterium]